MKIYFFAVLWFIVAIAVYGILVPFLVSYPDDILLLCGIVVGIVAAPVQYSIGFKIYKEIRRKLKV